MSLNTHHNNFDIFLKTLNENDIRFIFMRGYKYLPEKADTNLDTIIHPEDWEKYKNICSNLINNGIIGYEQHGVFKNYGRSKCGRDMIYYPIFTKGTKGEHLPNKSFRIDSYMDLFFFEGNKGKILPLRLLDYLFRNKKQINNYFIPDDISNIILLVCRNIYDKNGNWKASGTKHTSVIEKLISNVNKEDFTNISNILFNTKDNLYDNLLNKKYDIIKKPTKMLFLIRKTGLQRHPNTIEEVRKLLEENNYIINTEYLITIKENDKFLNNFYKDKMNNEDIKKAILQANENQCYIFITDYNNYKNNSVDIKNILRSKYPNPDNINWNYFHSSKNVDRAYLEIDIINSNQSNLKGIGNYYTNFVI